MTPATLACPECSNEGVFGLIVTDIWDGAVAWACNNCGHCWPRFSPEDDARLHEAGLEVAAHFRPPPG